MSIIGGAIAIQNFREKDFKLHPNAVNQKVKEKEKKLGRNVTDRKSEIVEELVYLAGDGEGRLKGEN